MTKSADEAFRDAGRRADARELILLAERFASGPPVDEREGAAYAASLPSSASVTALGSPEAALALAELHARLGPFLAGRSWPRWRAEELPVRVRIAWLCAELLNEPSVIRDEPRGELIRQAARQAVATEAHRLTELVDELAGSGDPVLRAEALRLARQGLRAGLLAPGRVRTVVTGLLDGDDRALTEAALTELTEPWAALDPLPSSRLAPFLATGSAGAWPRVADASLTVAAHHGHTALLRQVFGDQELPPALRRRALELLGGLAVRDDIGDLTALASRDPLLFGGALVACLRGLHRRGHFPVAAHVPSVVGLALEDHSIAPAEVATVLFTCREAMFHVLVDASADDPGWPRRLALLVALAGQGTGELPIGAAITRVLPLAPAPRPFLEAIRALRHTDAEEAVIALLPRAPAAALDALEAIGGHRTAEALGDGLGLGTPEADGADPAGIAPPLRAVRTRALELLWHLAGETEPTGGTGQADRRRALLVRLDPACLPPRIAADLGGPDEQEVALLAAHTDPGDPATALLRLAAHGSAGPLPVIADLLARIVTELAASREAGAAARPPRADGPPAGEPVVPQDVLDALHALGRRLHGRGKIRPSCLLDGQDARSAGHALVATTALNLLERPGLSDAEQVILLDVLLRAPYPRTRARVHRMLRHRDRHVRKHVIALLAQGTGGDDAQALSASLIALTTAGDIQTVRQSLLALGHAEARWASPAVAACLGHPNMNVKKTAAGVLVRIGTPAAVPELLSALGRHDNPGLYSTLVEALRAVLGTAYAATLLAAAERAGSGGRTVELLLEGLRGELTARAVRALDDQASPIAPALLALMASGRVTLAEGTAADLSASMARHGITPPVVDRRGHDGGEKPDPDVTSLTADGWNPSVALRVAQRDLPRQTPLPERLRPLRPLLPDWLRLAASEPSARRRVVRFVLRLCPAPWTEAELTAYARYARVLSDALPEAPDTDRQDLLAVLHAVAPKVTAPERQAVIDAVRSLPPGPSGSTSTLALLRRLDAVLVRSDLDQALAAARLGGDPWTAEAAVLRDTFGLEKPSAHPVPAGTLVWRSALEAAVRTPGALAAFPTAPDGTAPESTASESTVGSRDRLTALAEVYSSAAPEVRTALVDRMTALQPIDAPPWTLTEAAGTAEPPATRTLRADDLDQPRSTALRERLLAMLRGPEPDRRATAARVLLTWPGPDATVPVLRAFLHGLIDLPAGAPSMPPRTLAALDEAELRADGVLHGRVADIAAKLDPWDLEPLIPLLLAWWATDPPVTASAAGHALRHVPADVLAEHIGDHLAAGAWGYLDLLVDRPLLRTPELTATRRRLRAEGRKDLADRLRLVDGPLRDPHTAPRSTAPAEAPHRPSPPSPRELLELAGAGTTEQVRRALTHLTEADKGRIPLPELRQLLSELLRHPKPGVRLHALRTSRATMDRPTYLDHTSVLLGDAMPSIVRTAVRTLSHAAWVPAIPALAALLEHPHAVVRTAATEGLLTLGTPAIPTLRHAAARARPDKRSRYTDVLQALASAQD